VVGLTDGQVASGGDPVVYITLLDSQILQFELAPAAVRREQARGMAVGYTDTVNVVLARVAPQVPADKVVDQITHWKHLSAMTQAGQEEILIRSVVAQGSACLPGFCCWSRP